MALIRKLAVGAVSLASVATLAAAAPASAADGGTDTVVIEMQASPMCSGDWKKAGGVPWRWTTSTDNCSTFGSRGYRAAYSWSAFKGTTPCIKVRGYDSGGNAKWYDAGCRRSGVIRDIPWGNVAGNRAIQIKGATLLNWR